MLEYLIIVVLVQVIEVKVMDLYQHQIAHVNMDNLIINLHFVKVNLFYLLSYFDFQDTKIT